MNKEEIFGTFSLVNNPIVLSEEEVKDVQKAIKELQQENKQLKEIVQEVKDLEDCWLKGGTYLLPVEVMNNIFGMIEELEKGDSNE